MTEYYFDPLYVDLNKIIKDPKIENDPNRDFSMGSLDYPYSGSFVNAGSRILLVGSKGDDNVTLTGGNDTIDAGNGNDTVNGYDGDDILYGNNGHDLLIGGKGNDLIRGGGGNDNILSGAGNDTIYGGDGDDTAVLSGGGKDKAFMGAGNDFLIIDANTPNAIVRMGSGNDHAIANAINSTIYGEDGNDILVACASGAELFGGAGSDMLYQSISKSSTGTINKFTGGAGADQFVFDGNAAMMVMDFKRGEDKIDLGALGVFNSTGIQMPSFKNIIQNHVNGDLVIDASYKGNTATIILDDFAGKLTASDFIYNPHVSIGEF